MPMEAPGPEHGHRLVLRAGRHRDHLLLHLPIGQSSEACWFAEVARRAARRVPPEGRDNAQAFGERARCDLIGPVHEAPGRLKHLLVCRDEGTGHTMVMPLSSTKSAAVATAFEQLYPPRIVLLQVRPDRGSEFEGHVQRMLERRSIELELPLARRSTTHARAETSHITLEDLFGAC